MTTFELRLILRSLIRRPGFVALAIVPLALAIGATGALYRVLDRVVLEPRALLQSDELYILWESSARRDGLMSEISYPDFLEWREHASAFEDMAAMGSINWTHGWAEAGQNLRDVPYRAVTWSFFDTMGVDAAKGRTFLPEDDARDAPRVAMLSDRFWQTRLGGARDVVGTTIHLGPEGDEPYTVVGVMPPEFGFPQNAELWTPLGRDLAGFGAYETQVFVLFAVGRLRPDTSPERARADVSAVVRRLSRELHPGRGQPNDWSATLTPLETFELGNTPLGLVALSVAAMALLLLCGLSVGGLVLARAMAHRHELAIHVALGAGREAVARATLVESALLAFAGAALGIGVRLVAVPVLLTHVPAATTIRWSTSELVVFASAGIAVTLLVAFPTMLSIDPKAIARDVASAVATRGTLVGWHRPLIVSATAIAMLITAAAMLLVRSYDALTRADLGYRPRGVLSFEVNPPDGRSPRAFFRELAETTESIDGVIGAAVVRNRPLAHGAVGDDWGFIYEGQSDTDFDANPTVNSTVVSPGYFRVMGTRIVAGRDFDANDRESSELVVVVGESLAQYAWPGDDPLGKRLSFGRRDERNNLVWHRVIGVVADARYRGLTVPRLDLYHAFEQAEFSPNGIVALTRVDPYAVVPAIREQVRAIDETLELERVTSMDDAVAAAMAPWRFNMSVASAFAAFALSLSGLGLFGVIAYTASQRTRELGIRAAMGARPAQLWKLLTGDSLRLVAIGFVVGVAGALLGAKYLSSLLYGVAPQDARSFIAAGALLIGMAFVACHIPAHRAARISPLVALRHE